MTPALYVTFVVIFVMTSWIIGTIIHHRKKIPAMTGMVIAMSLGMMVGLTAGVILGILFSGNLFYATVLGIMVGIIIGFLSGLPVGIMAVLDGAISGMMGGMMGAMLGVMIAPEYQDSLVRIMFLLFIALTLILFLMMQQEFMKKSKKWLTNPSVIFSLFIVFIVGYNQMSPLISSSKSPNHDNHSPLNMVSNDLVIKADEYSFSTKEIKLPVGEKVTFVLNNTGEVKHGFEIVGLKTAVHLLSKPGGTKEVSFTPTVTGVYHYTCTIPGHAELGMNGTVKIISQTKKADHMYE